MSRCGWWFRNPREALQLLRGCCTGAGGTFTQFQDCVIWHTRKDAYTSCAVGNEDTRFNIRVRFPSGKVQPLEPKYRLMGDER